MYIYICIYINTLLRAIYRSMTNRGELTDSSEHSDSERFPWTKSRGTARGSNVTKKKNLGPV